MTKMSYLKIMVNETEKRKIKKFLQKRDRKKRRKKK